MILRLPRDSNEVSNAKAGMHDLHRMASCVSWMGPSMQNLMV